MNKLSTQKRVAVIAALVEGMSIRSVVRMTGVSKNTVVKLLEDIGQVCAIYQDKVFRDLKCKRIECDEIWSFVHAKEGHLPPELQGVFGYGDVYTWVAIDADTKLVPCWNVGRRDAVSGEVFIKDLASRLANRVQLSTDGFKVYLTAVEEAFGADIDFGMIVDSSVVMVENCVRHLAHGDSQRRNHLEVIREAAVEVLARLAPVSGVVPVSDLEV